MIFRRFVFIAATTQLILSCKRGVKTAVLSDPLDSPVTTTECGVISKNNSTFHLKYEKDKSREIEPQDGAGIEKLEKAAKSGQALCMAGDWSGTEPFMLVSVTYAFEPVNKDKVSRRCGSVYQIGTSVVMQLVDSNSEENPERALQAKDGATLQSIRNFASTLAVVCVESDFSKQTSPVVVTSKTPISKKKE